MQPIQTRTRRRLAVAVSIMVFAGAVAALVAWHQLFRRVPPPEFTSLEESFKYGSLSTARGIPLHILRVLPEVFPDKLPGTNGWRSFGMLVEDRHDLPVGWAVRTVGFPGVTFNCALCHSGSYRTDASASSRVVLGAPAHQLNFGAFLKFLADCADDPRFEAGTLLASIERTTKLTTVQRLTYRGVLVPALRKELRASRGKMAWMQQRPDAGCGRNDAFNVLKINILKLPDDGTIGTADFPSLWNQQARCDMSMHWSGAASNIHEAYLVSALAACGSSSAFDAKTFSRVTNFIWQLPPPRFPYAIDTTQAKQGQTLFDEHCATCHAKGAHYGKIIPGSQIGVDTKLADVVSTNLVAKINAMKDAPFRFDSWRASEGYVATPLDGCWLRAPYLHNGSVPTLWALLQPADQRPKKFVCGYDVFDEKPVGFVHDGAEARRSGVELDTSLRGNSSAGHEYGTNLSDVEKRALIEYLKTL